MTASSFAQTRMASLIETGAGTAFGFFVATWANLLILPLFGYNVTSFHALLIGGIFTGISLLRGYIFRRSFEYLRVTEILP